MVRSRGGGGEGRGVKEFRGSLKNKAVIRENNRGERAANDYSIDATGKIKKPKGNPSRIKKGFSWGGKRAQEQAKRKQ